jgi:hypothetical protein
MQSLIPTGMPFVTCSVRNKPKVKFMFSAEDKEHKAKLINKLINSHAQNTTALKPNLFLTGKNINRLLVTKNGGRFFPVKTTAKVNCKLHSQ